MRGRGISFDTKSSIDEEEEEENEERTTKISFGAYDSSVEGKPKDKNPTNASLESEHIDVVRSERRSTFHHSANILKP